MKSFQKNSILLIIFLLLFFFFVKEKVFPEKKVFGDYSESKEIILNDDGFIQIIKSNAPNVSDFLIEQKINIDDCDVIYPQRETKLLSGTKIKIIRPKKIFVKTDNQTKEFYGFQETVQKILTENNIKLGKNDIVKPSRESIVYNGLKIEIVRVKIKKEIVKEKIDYKTIIKKDKLLSWRKERVAQQGVKGVREVEYEVAYHNNNEVSRKIINSKVSKSPVPKIIIKGTYVKLGKKHKGIASWYTHTGTMSAANPWLPIGSYVKVTNLNNGKSVIVKINDRGPFGNGRIIDLDKVAFAKIAPLGQGTVKIKMEEILN